MKKILVIALPFILLLTAANCFAHRPTIAHVKTMAQIAKSEHPELLKKRRNVRPCKAMIKETPAINDTKPKHQF